MLASPTNSLTLQRFEKVVWRTVQCRNKPDDSITGSYQIMHLSNWSRQPPFCRWCSNGRSPRLLPVLSTHCGYHRRYNPTVHFVTSAKGMLKWVSVHHVLETRRISESAKSTEGAALSHSVSGPRKLHRVTRKARREAIVEPTRIACRQCFHLW